MTTMLNNKNFVCAACKGFTTSPYKFKTIEKGFYFYGGICHHCGKRTFFYKKAGD